MVVVVFRAAQVNWMTSFIASCLYFLTWWYILFVSVSFSPSLCLSVSVSLSLSLYRSLSLSFSLSLARSLTSSCSIAFLFLCISIYLPLSLYVYYQVIQAIPRWYFLLVRRQSLADSPHIVGNNFSLPAIFSAHFSGCNKLRLQWFPHHVHKLIKENEVTRETARIKRLYEHIRRNK